MTPEWWSTLRVGDRLREVGGPRQEDDHLLHVVAVFEDDGFRFAVTKFWLRSRRRWHYEVKTNVAATVGSIYLDGLNRPSMGKVST